MIYLDEEYKIDCESKLSYLYNLDATAKTNLVSGSGDYVPSYSDLRIYNAIELYKTNDEVFVCLADNGFFATGYDACVEISKNIYKIVKKTIMN